MPLTAGLHEIRATFLMKTNAVSEGFRKPFLKPYIGRGTDDNRETREGAALRELEIMGPLNPGGAAALAELSARLRLPAREGRPTKPHARRRFSRRWRAARIAGRSRTRT